MKYFVLFNPDSNNHRGQEAVKGVESFLNGQEVCYVNIHTVPSYTEYLQTLPADSAVVLTGGDGTINYFINHVELNLCKNTALYYYPAGTGNDFLRDAARYGDEGLISLNRYLENLPTVTIDGKNTYFINGIGYGIDGYCCEVADQIKAKSDKKINYTAIAIKGLLFHYKPTSAEIIVDGKTYTYQKVWLAPTMKGCFYGGGMLPAPEQNRFDSSDKVSCMVMYGVGKLKALMVFPGIFKGEHVKHTEMVQVHSGKTITVRFDRPTALQIDGETVLGVTSYTVHT